VLPHGPLRVRPVRKGVQTALAGATRPVGGAGDEGEPLTGIGGSAGDIGQIVHDRR
jgi:hypothetical protein